MSAIDEPVTMKVSEAPLPGLREVLPQVIHRLRAALDLDADPGAINAVLVLILSLSLSSALESQLLKGATDNISLRKMAANILRALLLVAGLMLALDRMPAYYRIP